ncbi:mutator mutT protein [Bacteriovorax sp. BSW11_IV]|uniref:NUDIX domain-containing protein n=1 Tax=Bacteriovorax sp. BSW11_IV TaxID=1353529 RepID=UPI00038A48CA|nr:NUDIX domain-containing protein [Bacteriovorax sp. BSW11_IV]EQC48305.1 mutator mutT protein [Bacteriovorax sp. BSW11_IV]
MIPVSIALFVKDIDAKGAKLWMQVRREAGPLDGLLEFPGGKIEQGELPVEACKREVEEEVGVNVPLEMFHQLKVLRYDFKDRSVLLNIFFSNFSDLPTDCGEWFEFDYVEKSKKYKGRLPEVNYEFIDQLLDYLKRQYDANCLERVWQK